ncbi:MAG: hypothetical protein AB7G88_07810, partial [Thermomicrobiales bacterium]
LEQLAIDRVQASLTSPTGQHASELMKLGFRDANRAIAESAGGAEAGVGMLALLTRGKYATLALVGPDRAYLARAGRLNQVTRDQRVLVPRSRRKKDAAARSDSDPAVRLLGEAERLDAKSPAIFEIVLLPEDRLALFSQDLVDLVGEDALKLRLQDAQIEAALKLDAFAAADGPVALMAAVLTAAPAREPLVIPQAATGTARPVWMMVIPLLLVLAIVAVVAFFLL